MNGDDYTEIIARMDESLGIVSAERERLRSDLEEARANYQALMGAERLLVTVLSAEMTARIAAEGKTQAVMALCVQSQPGPVSWRDGKPEPVVFLKDIVDVLRGTR